jgi:hypothetical protein
MSKEEPAWKAELREAMDERFPLVRNAVTRDAIREFCESQILAAEQRGFQAGVNKTGDSVGKLREQLKTARADALREALAAISGEQLSDRTGTPEDEAYGRGIGDAHRAVMALIDPDTP